MDFLFPGMKFGSHGSAENFSERYSNLGQGGDEEMHDLGNAALDAGLRGITEQWVTGLSRINAAASLFMGGGAARSGATTTAVSFGRNPNQVFHTFRHIEQIGMSRASTSRVISSDLARVAKSVAPGTSITRTISIGSIRIEYRAYKFGDGTMNVGSIFAVGSKR